MTALSRASNSIVGEMTGNVVAASWMDAESLLRVALWVIACSVCVVLAAGLWLYPVVRGVELEAVAVCRFSSCIVCDCWRCVRLLWRVESQFTRGLAALRWCLFVRAGVELPASARTVAILFPKFVSSVCVVLLLAFPLSSSPPVFLRGVAACSRAMLIVSAS
ncbi:putative trans-sialidase [Trypanosoma cruzi]|nr:putative trans-sialidase [Trypanosoma cruzi]